MFIKKKYGLYIKCRLDTVPSPSIPLLYVLLPAPPPCVPLLPVAVFMVLPHPQQEPPFRHIVIGPAVATGGDESPASCSDDHFYLGLHCLFLLLLIDCHTVMSNCFPLFCLLVEVLYMLYISLLYSHYFSILYLNAPFIKKKILSSE